ncbi:DEAD/DEAH box helicase [Mangrovimicrobium sediminis]|uniref:ATP-dependent RNA helicase DeaD n=1 Tax=Mangrovimicrobium sediminis TaxID=2562682 RepID=A0A4Z0LUY4_9GAMM|nr:DEAD/DEAH box helicase [Haliea sp. SAOS-164]TGD71089.1 DEAD/DEAH box helicase [Haliea sp. SAOS-164]
MSAPNDATSFADLALPEPLQQGLRDVGYETPSAIQARTIPVLLRGSDLVGQAQTGTGKTAAFALPALARLDLARNVPQVLVLAPTRELAIQVAEAFQKYAHYMPGFRILPLYGGSDYRGQLRQLERGVHVIVGTPGRVMDHMRRGSLKLDTLQLLVLDEADEMLRMGFIDDVEWVLTQTPPERQIALFSATMPDAIRRIALQHLREPEQVTIETRSVTNENIHQRVWMMAGVHKLDALTRILETEDTDGIIIFVRTRLATTELADKLAARGYVAAALNGDVAQKQREKTVDQLKRGQLDILVATDVAARGLDVERISHVINYDIPYDVEAYVHRIGRTGRAGRRGEAILFAANRERRLLRAIERATGQPIEPMTLPSTEQVADKRAERFRQRITEVLATRDIDTMRELVSGYQQEHGVPVLDIAAALAILAQGDKAVPGKGEQKAGADTGFSAASHDGERGPRESSRESNRGEKRYDDRDSNKGKRPRKDNATPAHGMERFRIEVGHDHGVKPGNIVGAIANEADIDAQYIGHIDIFDDHSTVELPEGMPRELFQHLKNVWVSGQRLQISRVGDGVDKGPDRKARKGKPNLSAHKGKKPPASKKTRGR